MIFRSTLTGLTCFCFEDGVWPALQPVWPHGLRAQLQRGPARQPSLRQQGRNQNSVISCLSLSYWRPIFGDCFDPFQHLSPSWDKLLCRVLSPSTIFWKFKFFYFTLNIKAYARKLYEPTKYCLNYLLSILKMTHQVR